MKRLFFHPEFPTTGCVLLGVGLAGIFDGLVLQQLLQWGQMLFAEGASSPSAHDLGALRSGPGALQVLSFLLVIHGIGALWRMARIVHLFWSSRLLLGSLLIGAGFFFLASGLVNFVELILNRYGEVLLNKQWLSWPVGRLILATGCVGLGWRLLKQGESISFGFVHTSCESVPRLPTFGHAGRSSDCVCAKQHQLHALRD